MSSQIDCQYFEKNDCLSITLNEEAKEVRKISCRNDNDQACCYLCEFYHGCAISCNYLGDPKKKVKREKLAEPIAEVGKAVLKCPLCKSKMLQSDIKLRTGGWSGLMQLLPFGNWGELGEELLPVTVHVCPKCGKLEFMAQRKTVEKIARER